MLLLLLACHPESPKNGLPALIDADGAELTVLPDARLQLSLSTGGERTFQIGFFRVSAYDPSYNYDPYLMKDPLWSDALPSGLQEDAAISANVTGSQLNLTLASGALATLSLDNSGPGIRVLLQSDDPDLPYAFVRTEANGDEAFYGLGECFGAVNVRGQVQAMHFVYDASMESSYNETHVPVPLLISSQKWGLRVDSFRPGVFDVAASSNTVEAIFEQGVGREDSPGFAFELYAPETPTDVLIRYHARAGLPEVPPTWAFAPLQWRNEVSGEDMLLADAQAIRENGIATGLIWVDNPWQSSYNSMQPDTSRFPNWHGMIQDLHDAGFRFMAWTTPYIEEADPEYSQYEAQNWLVDAPLLLNSFGPMVDFTQPEAQAAWEARVAAAYEDGIEGWKLDYGEDLQVGIGGATVQYGIASGQTAQTLHHDWASLYHQSYATPDQGAGFLLGRGGAMGSQSITDAIWPGDLDSDFRRFREEGHVGGLPSAIRGGSSLAASGFPFFASDTGGYRHDRPTHEAMVRWTEYSALLPIMQYGGGGDNHNPWDFTAYGDSQFTTETLEIFKKYATLHTRLFPYFYSLAQAAGAEGRPVVRAQGLAWPDAGEHPDNVFVVGDDLLVAPVEDEGSVSRDLTFPPGQWVHWWTGELYEGETSVTVDAPLGVGPLFQRVGSAIPMLRRSVVTLSPSDGSIDSWADQAGPLNARVIPAEGAGFSLDNGASVSVDNTGAIALVQGDLYLGWDIEVYAPDSSTISFNRVLLAIGTEDCTSCYLIDGPWRRIILPAGDGTLDLLP